MQRSTALPLLFSVLLGGLATVPGAVAKDVSVVAIDGFLRSERHGGARILVLTDHDGERYALAGDPLGLASGDHVRLLGRRIRDDRGYRSRVNGIPFAVTEVQAIWADERHRTVYFDHLEDGPFDRYAERYRQHRRWDEGRPGRDPWVDDSMHYGDWGEWRLPYHYGHRGERPPF